jgi:L-threonylcarbamoyladenylate synthase
VRGIYAAKQRPSNNPSIVHVDCLDQFRKLLHPRQGNGFTSPPQVNGLLNGEDIDPVPKIYKHLIARFGRGPWEVQEELLDVALQCKYECKTS